LESQAESWRFERFALRVALGRIQQGWPPTSFSTEAVDRHGSEYSSDGLIWSRSRQCHPLPDTIIAESNPVTHCRRNQPSSSFLLAAVLSWNVLGGAKSAMSKSRRAAFPEEETPITHSALSYPRFPFIGPQGSREKIEVKDPVLNYTRFQFQALGGA
jgi:hypothetical protein